MMLTPGRRESLFSLACLRTRRISRAHEYTRARAHTHTHIRTHTREYVHLAGCKLLTRVRVDEDYDRDLTDQNRQRKKQGCSFN